MRYRLSTYALYDGDKLEFLVTNLLVFSQQVRLKLLLTSASGVLNELFCSICGDMRNQDKIDDEKSIPGLILHSRESNREGKIKSISSRRKGISSFQNHKCSECQACKNTVLASGCESNQIVAKIKEMQKKNSD